MPDDERRYDKRAFGEASPVAGYRPQTEAAVALVNGFKEDEERLLRKLDQLSGTDAIDGRWLAIARTNLEQGFMALNRSVFQPQRVRLPDDEIAAG